MTFLSCLPTVCRCLQVWLGLSSCQSLVWAWGWCRPAEASSTRQRRCGSRARGVSGTRWGHHLSCWGWSSACCSIPPALLQHTTLHCHLSSMCWQQVAAAACQPAHANQNQQRLAGLEVALISCEFEAVLATCVEQKPSASALQHQDMLCPAPAARCFKHVLLPLR